MNELLNELESVIKDDEIRYALDDLVDTWSARSVGLDGVEAILHFIERHPNLDYGAPGGLVHFSEEFYRKGYEEALLRSFARRPTALTAWMLNRLINGTNDALECDTYIAALENGESNPDIDEETRAEINGFLNR